MKIGVKTNSITTTKTWTMMLNGQHESNPQRVAHIEAIQGELDETTEWTIKIYTNTTGVTTRGYTVAYRNKKAVNQANAMDELLEAWSELEQEAKTKAESMAQDEEQRATIHPAFANEQDKQEWIMQKADDIIISMRYIADN